MTPKHPNRYTSYTDKFLGTVLDHDIYTYKGLASDYILISKNAVRSLRRANLDEDWGRYRPFSDHALACEALHAFLRDPSISPNSR